jgi:hypothetical protein
MVLQNNIVNAERRGKRQVLIRPSSKVVVKFLSVMQRHGECPFLLRPTVQALFFRARGHEMIPTTYSTTPSL